jgi:hypothetical protein
VGIGVEHEENLGDLGGTFGLVVAVVAHVPLAVAAHAMRIDGQDPSLEVTRSPADLTQGDLEALTVDDGSSAQELVNGAISCEERDAVGQLEDVLIHGAAVPQTGGAQSRFVDQLQRQARLDTIRPLRGPRADQVPSTQLEQFGSQEPNASQVSHDLVGEQLAHAAFDTSGITGNGGRPGLCSLRLNNWLGIRAVAIEFFFEGRTLR